MLLQARNLRKSFGETVALSNCSFACAPGEIHAIVGENGCGKSTLVKILTGILTPDQGELLLRDRPVKFQTPGAARSHGVVSIPQEILVVPALSVLDNIVLGQGRFFGGPPGAAQRRAATDVLSLISSQPIPLDVPVETLPLSQQQIVVIARALVLDPDVVILDESTSALDVADRDRLFAVLRERRERQKSAIYISHRFDEILGLADRLTVIRGGLTIGTLTSAEATIGQVLEMMSGESLVERQPRWARGTSTAGVDTVLQATDVALGPGKAAINFSLQQGEIVGLAGLEGHGQEAFLEALAGLRGSWVGGSIVRTGDVRAASPIRSLRAAAQAGIAYVPRDRKTEGLFLKLDIQDNFSLPTLPLIANKRRIERDLRDYCDRLSISCRSFRQPVSSLSGGNQQKVIIARALAGQPQILMLNDPSRGVDIPTKRDLYDLFLDLVTRGISIVLLSTDLEELVQLCDRVMVFREREVFRELQGSTITRERLIAAMFGESA